MCNPTRPLCSRALGVVISSPMGCCKLVLLLGQFGVLGASHSVCQTYGLKNDIILTSQPRLTDVCWQVYQHPPLPTTCTKEKQWGHASPTAQTCTGENSHGIGAFTTGGEPPLGDSVRPSCDSFDHLRLGGMTDADHRIEAVVRMTRLSSSLLQQEQPCHVGILLRTTKGKERRLQRASLSAGCNREYPESQGKGPASCAQPATQEATQGRQLQPDHITPAWKTA